MPNGLPTLRGASWKGGCNTEWVAYPTGDLPKRGLLCQMGCLPCGRSLEGWFLWRMGCLPCSGLRAVFPASLACAAILLVLDCSLTSLRSRDYCAYFHEDYRVFDSPEARVLHFVGRASNKDWEWRGRFRDQDPPPDQQGEWSGMAAKAETPEPRTTDAMLNPLQGGAPGGSWTRATTTVSRISRSSSQSDAQSPRCQRVSGWQGQGPRPGP